MSLIHEALEKQGILPQQRVKRSITMEIARRFYLSGYFRKFTDLKPMHFSNPIKDPAQAEIPEKAREAFSVKKESVAAAEIMSMAGLAFLVAFCIFYFARAQQVVSQSVSIPAQPVVSAPPADESRSFTDRVKSLNPFSRNKTRGGDHILSGITGSDGERLALIDDRVVRVGERLDSHSVVSEIKEKVVILNVKGRQVILAL